MDVRNSKVFDRMFVCMRTVNSGLRRARKGVDGWLIVIPEGRFVNCRLRIRAG